MHLRDLWYLTTSVFTTRHDAELTPAEQAAIADAQNIVEIPPPLMPLDTIMWAASIQRGDYIPDGVKEEMALLRRTDFTKLDPAKDFPTDKQAQEALEDHHSDELVNLLKAHHAHIRIGKCYYAVLRQDNPDMEEVTRVTAMVSAFNDKNQNLGNIQLPLITVYDFVKYAGHPDRWYATDFSQTLPFDYVLNK
ncbi:hypothetical protein [Pedobacter metabolipauper]|nr:hypothetical protein [Pedobacter metabolipauper]